MADIEMIMERVAPGAGAESFVLYACRGTGRGCRRNVTRATKKHCDDCLLALESETLGELKARLQRGDA